MTDHSNNTPEANLVAIDIAKQWNVVLVKDSSGRKRTFKVANTAADHEQLIRFLMALPGHVRIALEPTGDYHRPLAFRLLQAGFQVVSISSVAQARFREARYGTWDKNDPKDARVILAMLEHGLVQTYYDPLFQGTHDLQELSNTYYQVTLARTRLQHSLLLHHLPLYFPEFARYWYSTRSEWFIRFLIRFPIPSAIHSLPRDRFVAEAWDLVGRKCAKQAKLEEIHELACASIRLPVALDSPAIEAFRLQLQRYQELNERRKWLDTRARELLVDNADFNRLIQLPGIAAITALTILAEAGDLRRFGHHRQFLKYCGLDLVKSQSGQSSGKETLSKRLSKRGNRRLRMIFWLAGLRAIHLRENEFRAKYQRYMNTNPLDQDRKRKALTAIAAKMARVVYAVVKHGAAYQPFSDQRLPSGSIPLTRAVEAS
jgi:transposase